MRISDWSSDVCSSDLTRRRTGRPSARIDAKGSEKPSSTTPTRSSFFVPTRSPGCAAAGSSDRFAATAPRSTDHVSTPKASTYRCEIGSASSRESGCQDVESQVVDVELKKKKTP